MTKEYESFDEWAKGSGFDLSIPAEDFAHMLQGMQLLLRERLPNKHTVSDILTATNMVLRERRLDADEIHAKVAIEYDATAEEMDDEGEKELAARFREMASDERATISLYN